MQHAYLLDGKGGGRPVAADELAQWTPEQGPLWIHLGNKDVDGLEWLKEVSGLDEVALEAILAEETRPRCVATDSGFLINMRGVNQNPGEDPEDMVSLRMWVEPSRMISVRRRRTMAMEGLAREICSGHGPADGGGLLVRTAELLLDRIEPLLEELEDRVDKLEEEADTGDPGELQSQIAGLRSQIITLRRHLAPQRLAMIDTVRVAAPVLGEHGERMSELADQVTRHVETLDEVRERTVVVKDLLSSRQADETNQKMLVLALVTAVFLPLGLLTGLLGINVGGMPGEGESGAFWVVCVLIVAIVIWELWYFRKRGWWF